MKTPHMLGVRMLASGQRELTKTQSPRTFAKMGACAVCEGWVAHETSNVSLAEGVDPKAQRRKTAQHHLAAQTHRRATQQ